MKHDYIEKYDLTRFDKIALEGGQITPTVKPTESKVEDSNEQFYYVTVGYYRSLSNAQKFANQLRSRGIKTTIQKGRLEQQ